LHFVHLFELRHYWRIDLNGSHEAVPILPAVV